MWLSFAIAPCVLAAAVNKESHDCCPHLNEKAGTNAHKHDEGKCGSCDLVKPVLLSADEYIQSSISSSFDNGIVILEWNNYLRTKPVIVTFKLPTPDYQSTNPSLRYRVLLI